MDRQDGRLRGMPDDDQDLSRRPPAAVRRELRHEISFGCPASGCGNPYLQYHHFDPPWQKEHPHDTAKATTENVEDLHTGVFVGS